MRGQVWMIGHRQVETILAGQGGTRPQKLKAAVALVGRIIKTSQLLAGKKIADEAKFKDGINAARLVSMSAARQSSCTVGASACGTKQLRQRASYMPAPPTATRSSDSKVRCV